MRFRPLLLRLVMLLLLGTGTFAGAAADWGVSKPVPPFDAFWEQRPRPDPNTVFLWGFDEKETNDEEALAALEAAAEDADTAPAGPELVAAQESVECHLAGDAAVVPEGRFGGGLTLRGAGAATGTVKLRDLLESAGALTLDLWLRPAPAAASATLLALAARDGSPLFRVRRDAGGTVSLLAGEDTLAKHSRPAPDGVWSHVALVLRNNGSAALLVNGTPQETPPRDPAVLARLALLGTGVSVGAAPGPRDGLTGGLDAVRLGRRERLFYEWADDAFCDPKAERPLAAGPPFFARRQPLPVRCSFDGTLQPEEFAGLRTDGEAAPELFRPGVRGQALDLSRLGAAKFALVGHNVLPLARGTIEFWFRPLGWNNFFHGDYLGTDLPWLPVLQFAQADCPPWRGLRVLRLAQGQTHKDFAGNAPWIRFHPGRWTHVVCTWSEAGTRVYLDGEPQPIDQVAFAGPLHIFDKQEHERWLAASAGKDDGAYRLVFLPSATLIDELRIYPYPLAPEEARNACARYFPDAAERLAELPAVRADYAYDYYRRHLALGVACMPVDGTDPTTVAVELLPPGGGAPLFAGEAKLDDTLKARLETDVELGFGTYPVEIECRDAQGKPLKTLRTEYVRPQPLWWQNALGKGDQVPKPWTPIRVEGTDRLSVWGRTLTLRPGGLPAALTSADADLLAAPVTLTGRVAGTEAVFAGKELQANIDGNRATWTAALETQAVRAQVAGELEYDGLMTFTVTLLPAAAGAPVDLEALHLDIPLRPEAAAQLIANGGGFNFRAAWDVRMLPAGDGRVWDSQTSKPKMDRGVIVGSFLPVIWLGDDARGLCFYGDNDAGWTPGPEQPAQEVRREGGAVVLRLNVITRPVRLEQERTFRFCLQATPTKPLPVAWRAYNRMQPGTPVPNAEVIDQFQGRPLTAPADRPRADINFQLEPESWEAAALHAAWLRDKFGTENPLLFYIDYSWPKLGPTMADYMHSLWAGTGRMAWTREVEDYFVWLTDEYLKRGLFDGLYIDDVSLGRTFALYSTAYRLEDGRVQPGFNTLGFRRFLQRVWVLCDQAGKPPRIVPHMTWCFEIPALSFCDAAVNGEDRDILFPNEARYTQVWGRDELRIMGGSEKWGFVTLWKSGLSALQAPPGSDTRSWMYWQSRALHGHLFQHRLTPMWADEAHATFTPALGRFGIGRPDERFIADWERGATAHVEAKAPEQVMACFLARPDRALLMLTNYAGDDQEVTVRVDAQALFGAPGALSFSDADETLRPPAAKAATKAEVKAARSAAGQDLLGETGNVTEAGALDELEGLDPAAKESARLAPQAEGNSVRVTVRARDFRLLLVTPGAGKQP